MTAFRSLAALTRREHLTPPRLLKMEAVSGQLRAHPCEGGYAQLQVKVFVTPRKGILDPQGRAVESALKSLGFSGIAGVHIGRYIVLEIDAPSKAAAEATARKMCDQLLANPLIEDYQFEVSEQ